MNHLRRELAPVGDAAWTAIDGRAASVLRTSLAARRLVDFSGPKGYLHAARDLGRATPLSDPPHPGVAAMLRHVMPLVELRAEFELSLEELDQAERGAVDLDLSSLDDAARNLAIAENIAIFHGYEAAGIAGIAASAAHAPVRYGADLAAAPRPVAKAVEVLRSAGVDGPYALALPPEVYTGVVETAEHGGVLLLEHLRQILGGPIVWAPGLRSALVCSLRGGDFAFECGEDVSIGYRSHDAATVRCFLEESFTFQVAGPEAAVALAS